MEIRPGDILTLRKPHPCGAREWHVLRVGMEFKLRCGGCGHETWLPRAKAEKAAKSVMPGEGTPPRKEPLP